MLWPNQEYQQHRHSDEHDPPHADTNYERSAFWFAMKTFFRTFMYCLFFTPFYFLFVFVCTSFVDLHTFSSLIVGGKIVCYLSRPLKFSRSHVAQQQRPRIRANGGGRQRAVRDRPTCPARGGNTCGGVENAREAVFRPKDSGPSRGRERSGPWQPRISTRSSSKSASSRQAAERANDDDGRVDDDCARDSFRTFNAGRRVHAEAPPLRRRRRKEICGGVRPTQELERAGVGAQPGRSR